jgi:hypothetical protein
VTHKANCDDSKTQESLGDDDTKALDSIGQTTGRKYKTVNCKNKLHKLTQNEEQDTNIKHSVQNCQVSSSEINIDPQERFLGHGVQVETIKQQTKTLGELTKVKENEKCVDSHDGKRDLSRNDEVEEYCHEPTTSKNDISNVVVYVKYAKEKHKVQLRLPCTGVQVIEHFSRILHVPVERLKLIHKGKLQTESTILESLKPNSVFLAFGEVAESEDGLEAEDIELIMKQLSVERNVAIKALRKTNSLIDAIFEIGNDM